MADYLELSLRAIHNVNGLVSDGRLEINENLCKRIINHELQVTKGFLNRNQEKLRVKDAVHDKRRVALLHLYPVVKQAEKLVRHCCDKDTTGSAWPQRALSAYAIKEDALDILLHLWWWTSVLGIAIDLSLTSTEKAKNVQYIELKRTLEQANQNFEDALNIMALFDTMWTLESVKSHKMSSTELETLRKIEAECPGSSGSGSYRGERGTQQHLKFIFSCTCNEGETSDHRNPDRTSGRFKDVLAKCIELQIAALQDKDDLKSKALEAMKSYTGRGESRGDLRERCVYSLLVEQVHSLLADVEVEGVPELNKCEEGSVLGRGNFGIVYGATWCEFDCCLKKIICGPDQRSEAKHLKRFSHPHIVKLFRHFETSHDGTENDLIQSHIVMERMSMDLSRRMKVKKSGSASSTRSISVPFSEQVTVDIMLQLAKAMWHMHSKYMVHRDLKPGNVLVRELSEEEVGELFHQGYVQVKLGDFGLGRGDMYSSNSQLYMSYRVGTTLYRAPEFSSPDAVIQKINEEPHEKRMVVVNHPLKADVWSFGILSCEILSGKIPYDNIRANLQEEIQKGVRPWIPETCPNYLKFCIESCWKYEPRERPRFSDVWRMLRIAKLRSLGLLDNNYDWFRFKVRNNSVSMNDAMPVTPSTPSTPLRPNIPLRPVTPLRPAPIPKPVKRPFSLMSILIKFNIFGRPRDAKIHFESPFKQPFKFITNRVWPRDPTSDWNLDVIFFEGNVGGRKALSCRDTWLQRKQPNVFWPREWLPHDVDGKIRVLMLEYCISETDRLEGLVSEIQKYLVFSDRWNQNLTWRRPIVLVGHSLGCSVIEALLLDLDRNARQLGADTTSEYDRTRVETSRAFMSSLRGCFFYAHPMNGLIRRQPLLTEVFGGLTYSRELFNREFLVGAAGLQERSSNFLELTQKRNPHISLMSLVEGGYTRGTFVVNKVFPPELENLRIKPSLELEDSNHIEICKPVDREHASYQELVKFLKEICNADERTDDC